MWASGRIVHSASPALLGRYGLIAFDQLEGSRLRIGGSTNMIPTSATMPPAVWRTIAPIPRPKMPITVRKSAAPITARGDARVGERDLEWRLERIDWPTKNAIRTAGRLTTRVTTANTPAFAHSTGRRLGTAQNVERIMPVVYSPVITSTPSTPIESCARLTPARLGAQRVVGSAARSPGLRCGQRAANTVHDEQRRCR